MTDTTNVRENTTRDNKRSELTGMGWLFLLSMVLHTVTALFVNMLSDRGIMVPTAPRLIMSQLTIVVPAIIYILIRRLSLKDDLGLRPIKAGSAFMCILLTVLITPLASLANVISQFFVKNELLQMSDSLLDVSPIPLLFLGGIFGPLCEEFVFRAVFNNRYSVYLGPMRAGLISALLFGLAHMNINQCAYAFVLGVVFAIINRAANSVFPSMIIHACINLGNILMLVVSSKIAGMLGSGTDIAAQAEAARNSDVIYVMAGVMLVFAIIFGIAAIPCIIWLSKHEGGFKDLCDMFTNRHATDRWMTAGLALGIIYVLFVMFGLEPLLNVIKGKM